MAQKRKIDDLIEELNVENKRRMSFEDNLKRLSAIHNYNKRFISNMKYLLNNVDMDNIIIYKNISESNIKPSLVIYHADKIINKIRISPVYPQKIGPINKYIKYKSMHKNFIIHLNIGGGMYSGSYESYCNFQSRHVNGKDVKVIQTVYKDTTDRSYDVNDVFPNQMTVKEFCQKCENIDIDEFLNNLFDACNGKFIDNHFVSNDSKKEYNESCIGLMKLLLVSENNRLIKDFDTLSEMDNNFLKSAYDILFNNKDINSYINTSVYDKIVV